MYTLFSLSLKHVNIYDAGESHIVNYCLCIEALPSVMAMLTLELLAYVYHISAKFEHQMWVALKTIIQTGFTFT